ncbi:MAG: hypothetical protein ABL962_01130 [Fimbriimonadaceae bacterium]
MFRGFLVLIVAGALISASAGPKVDYSKDVQPSVKKYCVSCHGPKEPAAKIDLSKHKTNADVKKAKKTFAIAIKELEAKRMPPAGSTPLPADVRTKLIARLKTLTQ